MIVTVDDLQHYMSDVTFSADQRAAAQDVLAGVQGDLELYLNRTVEVVEVTETLEAVNGYVFPRKTPVVEILSVDGLETPAGGFSYNRVEGLYLGWGGSWTVTYRSGLNGASIPGLRLAIMRVAKRDMQTNHDDALTSKDLSASDPGGGSWRLSEKLGWQDDELKRFSRYRRRVIT